jgi:hypothetical protein
MQNKSYDHYVELLRAAELQTLERTSSRFVASLGTASAGAGLTRNPLTSVVSAFGAIVFVAVSAYSVWIAGNEPTSQHLRKQSSSDASVTVGAPSTQQSISSHKSTQHAKLTSKQIIEKIGLEGSAEDELVESNEASVEVRDITPVAVRHHEEAGMIASSEVKALRVTRLGSEYVDRLPHSWSVSLTALNLTSFVYQGAKADFRTTAWLETGNGLVFGVAVGMRSVGKSSADFSGFKDTVFMIDEREFSSKIGQIRSSSTSNSYLEAGVAASYQFLNSSETVRLRPAISIFAGLEGKAVVLEQSLSINWLMSDRFSTFGGVSLREYPAIVRAAKLSPMLGIRMGL